MPDPSGRSLFASPSLETLWCAPDLGCIKINCDGAWCKETKEAGLGVIARNHHGMVVAGTSISSHSNSALIVEASAALEGLKLAKAKGFQDVIMEIDSEQLFLAVSHSSLHLFWEIYPLIKQIRSFQSQLNCCRWSLVKRASNAAADLLAVQAKKRMDLGNWVLHPPSSLVNVLRSDGLPAPPDFTCN